MEITLNLDVPDEYIDEEHHMGLTEEGFDALTDALLSAGFSIVSGPNAV